MNYQNESLASLKKLEMFAMVSDQKEALKIIQYYIGIKSK